MFINYPEVHVPVQGMEAVPVPEMVTIRQRFDPQKITDLSACLSAQMCEMIKNKAQYDGKRICITVGSRGIPGLDLLVKTMCDVLKDWGASPFLIPSMGSHGGATAEGQLEILAGYNITEASMGVPILSSMETVQYGTLDGLPLYCDKNAYEADGIVIFNKVKPHTDFRGRHESGLSKMIAIGIAKHKGATMFHSFGFQRFAELIPRVAEIFLNKCKVAFGVGVVQNAYDEICSLEVCTSGQLLETDATLLEIAKTRMAKFKFDDIDLLIIDEIGKNISGNGFDPNIVGRNMTNSFSDVLKLKKLFVRGLTKESHHSGCGLSCADLTTRLCLSDVDWEVTWANCQTTGVLTSGAVPMYVNTDREAVLLCIKTCRGLDDYRKARVVRIKNTLCMEELQVSKPLYDSIRDADGISYISGPVPMEFTADGALV
jgi:hypothetical protein